MIYQIIYGIFCLQQCLDTYHSDLKPKNILYKNLEKPINVHYTIKSQDNKELHTVGFKTNTIFMISDFGHAQSLLFDRNEIPKASIKLFIQNNADLEHLATFHKRLIVTMMLKVYSYNELIKLAKDDEHLSAYIEEKKEKLDKNMNMFPEPVRKKMLQRSIAYYLLEKGYVTISSIPNKQPKIYLPSNMIMNLLTQLETKQNILDFLKLSAVTINKVIDATYDIEMCIKAKTFNY